MAMRSDASAMSSCPIRDGETMTAPDPDTPSSAPGSRTYLVTLQRPDGTWTFAAPADEFLLYAMLDAGIECPNICEQGWCLACAARLESGVVDCSAALTNYPEDAEAGFILLCSTLPLSDLVLTQDVNRTRREMTQHRIGHNQLARAYPPGLRASFRRGRAK